MPIAESTFALRDSFRHALTLLLWGLAALLLMMCANVGGLLLGSHRPPRARHRRPHRARRQPRTPADHSAARIRRSRPRWRLRRPRACLCLGAPFFVRLLPLGSNANPVSLAPNFSIALVALGLALLLSILFGAVPAWLTSRAMPQQRAAARRLDQQVKHPQPRAARPADCPHARSARRRPD